MKGFYSEMIQEINEMIEKGEEASALNKSKRSCQCHIFLWIFNKRF